MPPTTGDRLSIRTCAVIGGISMVLLVVLLLYGYQDEYIRRRQVLRACCRQEALVRLINQRKEGSSDRKDVP